MKYSLLFCILLFSNTLFSQEGPTPQTTYRTESFASFATGENTPFWMLYHNWGMTPLESNNFYLRGGIFHRQKINPNWSFKLGIDLAGSSPHSFETVWIQQLYGELNWKTFRINIGAMEDYHSLLDEYLSSGDFTRSNNARPLPEVKFSIPDFVLIPYTKGNMYIKGDFAVGKYLDGDLLEEIARPANQPYVQDILSHYKSISFRFGNLNKNKLQFSIDMNHRVQWGGVLYQKERWMSEYQIVDQPQGLKDFIRVMIAKEGGGGGSGADQAYVTGSQIGSYTFKFDYKLNPNNIVSIYNHHFFEDGSGMAFENYRDRLLGIQYKTSRKQLLSNILFEYIYTKHQTGPIHFNLAMDEDHAHLRKDGNGNDNYYNNVDYVQGPSYYGRTQGTPLFLSPEYNKDGRLNFKESRVIAFHLGLEGYFTPHFSYRILATNGRSWGRYSVPLTAVKEGYAANLDLRYSHPKLNGLDIKLSSGFNTGDFFRGETFGMGVTLTKKGIIR